MRSMSQVPRCLIPYMINCIEVFDLIIPAHLHGTYQVELVEGAKDLV